MGRLVGIDYGTKRTGLAVTDPLQIIATALDTVPTKNVLPFLKQYCKKEQVDSFIIGMPRDLSNRPTDATPHVMKFIEEMKNEFSEHTIHLHDERFTSKMALDTMIRSGSTRKQRKKKENIDKISATIILQSFMESKQHNQ